jgi:hypothetical protein
MLTSRSDTPHAQQYSAEPVRASRAMTRAEGDTPPPFPPLALKGNDAPTSTRRRPVRVMIRYQEHEAQVVRERAAFAACTAASRDCGHRIRGSDVPSQRESGPESGPRR